MERLNTPEDRSEELIQAIREKVDSDPELRAYVETEKAKLDEVATQTDTEEGDR